MTATLTAMNTSRQQLVLEPTAVGIVCGEPDVVGDAIGGKPNGNCTSHGQGPEERAERAAVQPTARGSGAAADRADERRCPLRHSQKNATIGASDHAPKARSW